MLFYLQSGVGKLTHAMLAAESGEGEQKDIYRIMRRWRTRVAGEGQSSVLERERREVVGGEREEVPLAI